jgi:hypothetical protein
VQTKDARRPATKPAEPALPTSREELLVAHAEARRRRHAAPLGDRDWEAASAEVARIEVEIARLERELDPPRV